MPQEKSGGGGGGIMGFEKVENTGENKTILQNKALDTCTSTN